MRKEFDRTPDGTIVGSRWNINVNGTLIADKGSPDSDGTYFTASGYPDDETIDTDARLASLLRKQEAMRSLFSSSNNGKLFEIQPLDGSPAAKFNATIVDLNFTRRGNDPWVNMMEYSLQLETDCVFIAGSSDCEDSVRTDHVSNAVDEWSIEAEDQNQLTYRLTHRVSATGKKTYDINGNVTSQAWENAKAYVLGTLGIGLVTARKNSEDVLDLDAASAYNYVRSENTNELSGEFSVTETWLVYEPSDGIAGLEEFTVDTRTSSDTGLTTVVVSGTVTGLEIRNNITRALVSTKYANAVLKFNSIASGIHTRAESYSATTLNANLLSSSISRNEKSGVINYSYEFDNRANPTISGARIELITISYDNPSDVIAEIAVIGRAAGPILQNIGTSTARGKSVNIDLLMPCATVNSAEPNPPDTDALVVSLAPVATLVYLRRDQVNWVPRTGKYSRSVSWTYEV